jgi:hypothetical protein
VGKSCAVSGQVKEGGGGSHHAALKLGFDLALALVLVVIVEEVAAELANVSVLGRRHCVRKKRPSASQALPTEMVLKSYKNGTQRSNLRTGLLSPLQVVEVEEGSGCVAERKGVEE